MLLKTDAFLRFRLSKAASQVRGKLLSEIIQCYLKIQEFNQKLSSGSYATYVQEHTQKALSCLKDSIGSLQNSLCNYLIDKKLLKTIKPSLGRAPLQD